MILRFLWVLVALFPLSEIMLAIVKRSRDRVSASEDRGSLRLLWLAIGLGGIAALSLQRVPAGRFSWPADITVILAFCLMLAGLAIRWAAILTLGRLFTVDVAIQSGHVVVQTGPYRLVRHPSYTGLLLAFLGLGLIYTNWLSLFALMFPITLAVANRVAKEERALHASLGAEYAAYCARTKRFIPGLI